MKATQKFNENFYQPNYKYTRDFAEQRLIEKGFSNFHFTGCSYAHGASFYFILEDGRKVRVSDHPLTGNRAFDYIQVMLFDKKYLPTNEKREAKRIAEREEFQKRLALAIASKTK